ncbi:MAG: hypothetical protein KDK70_19255 [Myxococcales bacterium]|nr:hypothetical protein [Myxococcales bacterium]
MLKKVAIALGVLLLLAAGVVAYLWHQATALPDWYTEGELGDYAGEPVEGEEPGAIHHWIALDEQGNQIPDFDPASLPRRYYTYDDPSTEPPAVDPAADPAAGPTLRKRMRSGSGSGSGSGKTKAKRHELRGFHVRTGKDGKPQRSPAVRASRAVYEDGRLEVGLILDLSRLPKDELRPRSRERYERAVTNFPGLTKRDVWVGVEDEPISVEGYLQLSPGAEVRVGKLTYSLATAAKRMGMTELEMRMEINRELRRLGFTDPEA